MHTVPRGSALYSSRYRPGTTSLNPLPLLNTVPFLPCCRSGSTALVDALNQIPGYLIRGEQGGTFYQLFEAYRYDTRVQYRYRASVPKYPSQHMATTGAARFSPAPTTRSRKVYAAFPRVHASKHTVADAGRTSACTSPSPRHPYSSPPTHHMLPDGPPLGAVTVTVTAYTHPHHPGVQPAMQFALHCPNTSVTTC